MDSQRGYINDRTDIGDLLHENYMGKIKPHFKIMDPLLTLFKTVGNGGYTLTGKKLVLKIQTKRRGGAMGTDGTLPNHQYAGPTQLETTPGRFYVRGAIDNFMEAVSDGPGSSENLLTDINRQIWDAFEEMQIRHLHGSSAATVCVVDVRTSATVVSVKDGHGYVGQDPTQFIETGNVMWLAALDASAAFAVLGAAYVSDVDYDTKVLTFASSIEGAGTIATGDLLVMSTTPVTTDDHFLTERGRAKLGFLDHIDPLEANTSYLTIAEADEPRFKPYRVDHGGVAITELAFMKFVKQLGASSTSPVNPSTHTMSTHPGIVMALAEDIMGNATLNLPKGKVLEGGWETVRIGGHDFLETGYHIWDAIYAHPMDDYRSVDLDGEARVWQGDGNQFSRISDFDGKEWFVRHYGQDFVERRNRIGVMHSIANADASLYSNSPS